MSVLYHRPAAAAWENAGGGVRGRPWEGACMPLAVQEPDRPDSTGSLNRLSFSGPLKGEGPSDLEVGIRDCSNRYWRPSGRVPANVPQLPELTTSPSAWASHQGVLPRSPSQGTRASHHCGPENRRKKDKAVASAACSRGGNSCIWPPLGADQVETAYQKLSGAKPNPKTDVQVCR
ncbi:hypothetical protein P7K49_023415 [Saguinus oedipus]|uniref:Prolactin receptor n=1 Tax=Saguinus oedipus TaxID=9490 RepID=A0ABQ9ULP4_SAGOE|nr:hypothetical protein P7K49_023415 [Saguinus oedipus]